MKRENVDDNLVLDAPSTILSEKMISDDQHKDDDDDDEEEDDDDDEDVYDDADYNTMGLEDGEEGNLSLDNSFQDEEEQVWVTRNGVASANWGEMGVMCAEGRETYIVQGRGNKDTFHSRGISIERKLKGKQKEKFPNYHQLYNPKYRPDLEDTSTLLPLQHHLVDIVHVLKPLRTISAEVNEPGAEGEIRLRREKHSWQTK